MTSTPEPRGWNTWDIRYHTGVTHLPSGLRLRVAFDSGPGTDPIEGFTWRHGLADLGRHTIDGRYAEAAVTADGARLSYRFESDGDVVSGRASLTEPQARHRIVLIVDSMDGEVDVTPELTVRQDGREWRLRTSGVTTERVGGALHLFFDAEARFDCRPADATPPPEVGASVGGPLAPELRTSGWLGESGAALARALPWNTVFAPAWQDVTTPASRDFVCREREGFYRGIAVHCWDSFLCGMLAGMLDPAYALGMFTQALDRVTPEGFVPNRVSDERGTTTDRSQPPVGSLAVLHAYLCSGLSEATRDRGLLDACFTRLRRWNAWWPAARRGPHGMLAFGSDPIAGNEHAGTLDATKRESGLDDSPMYDEARYDPATHTMDLADVGLTALYAADLEALTEIAGRLGDDSADVLRAEYERWRAAIDATLFDEASGVYRNRHADGTFSPHTSPTLLYPLLAGVPAADRAAAIADVLLRPEVLGGSPPLVSTARDDPGFSDTYWRGRVWGPIAYLAAEGLRRYDLDEHLAAVADELLALHAREWSGRRHVRENYPATPGEDVNPLAMRSDALHPWGNLLCYVAVRRLVDARVDGWRFAHPGRVTEISGIRVAEGLLTVRADDRLTVLLDDQPLFVADPAVVIEAVSYDKDVTSARLRTVPDAAGRLAPVTVRGPDGLVEVAAPPAGTAVEIAIRATDPTTGTGKTAE